MKNKKNNDENAFISTTENKRKDVLRLKEVIDHNKEQLQTKANKNRINELKNQQMLIEEKNKIIERGENPNFFIPRKIKLEELEKSKK
jgi:hypothetical protein